MHRHELRGDRAVAGTGVVGRHPPERRTQPGNAATQCRLPDRAAEIGPLRQRSDAGRHRHRPAASRATACSSGIPWVDGLAVELVVGEPAPGEFRCVAAANRNRAGPAQVGHRGAVMFGDHIGKGGDPARRGAALVIGIDLCRERNTVQRPDFVAFGQCTVGALGGPACFVGQGFDDRVQPRIDGFEPRQAGLDCLLARHRACADRLRQPNRIPTPKLVRHRDSQLSRIDHVLYQQSHRWRQWSAAGEFLAQDFELQPALLGRGELAAAARRARR